MICATPQFQWRTSGATHFAPPLTGALEKKSGANAPRPSFFSVTHLWRKWCDFASLVILLCTKPDRGSSYTPATRGAGVPVVRPWCDRPDSNVLGANPDDAA
jgi:hypothetical protein